MARTLEVHDKVTVITRNFEDPVILVMRPRQVIVRKETDHMGRAIYWVHVPEKDDPWAKDYGPFHDDRLIEGWE